MCLNIQNINISAYKLRMHCLHSQRLANTFIKEKQIASLSKLCNCRRCSQSAAVSTEEQEGRKGL